MKREQSIKSQESSLPSGYTKLAYLESTGSQYINTGVSNVGSSFRLVVEQAWTDDNTYQAHGTGRANGEVVRIATYTGGGLLVNAQSYGTWEWIICAPFDTGYHIYDIQNGSQKLDGVTVKNNTCNGWVRAFYLFTSNMDWAPPSSHCRCKLRGCQIWDNGSQIRNLIPALRTSDNKPGLYDTVNGVFYVNEGSGEFLYG